MAERPRVVLGVGGGIAAYKACEVLRGLTESGHDVRVVPTAAALKFVGAATFEALSGHPVHTDVFTEVPEVQHVRVGQEADLVLVVPATADLLAKAAHGVADDLLTNTLLMARCPVVFFPAMHTEMWEHPATRDNVALLRSRGVVVTEPDSGRLTGKDTGKGRLADPREIVDLAKLLLAKPNALPRDLEGVRVVVSAGGTREPLDPVGAEVTLVAAHTAALPDPAGAHVVSVSTAAELQVAMEDAAAEADVVVMAAAVADFRPAERAECKIKKQGDGSAPTVTLTRNPDILAGLAQRRRPGQILVGFAAETGDEHGSVLDHGRIKLKRKGVDLLVLNAVGEGRAFEVDENTGWLLSPSGLEQRIPLGAKSELAATVWDAVAELVRAQGRRQ